MRLDHLQNRFYKAIRGAAPLPRLGPSGIAPEVSWRIYRNNYMETHVAALQATFASVAALVGPAFFRQLARQYVAWSDSDSGDLNDYGSGFPDLLDGPLRCAALPCLADLARLDWAHSQVLRSGAEGGDWLPSLLALDPLAWPRVTVRPAAICLRSAYPLHALWRMIKGGGMGAGPAADPALGQARGGQAVLISRGSGVLVSLMSAAEAAFTDCWLKRGTLAQAFELGHRLDRQFDIGALLTRLSMLGAIAAIELSPVES